MPNRYLTGIQKIVLQAGHGGGDPGATGNSSTENVETNQIVARLARILRFNNLNVVIDPDLSLANAVSYVNRNYKFGQDWLLEIHKDSAAADPNLLRNRMGIYYYGGDIDSQNIAQSMIQIMESNGASPASWANPDTVSRFGRLGWIRDTIPLAHLIECGFMQDDIGDVADEKYAKWVAQAICGVLEKPFLYDLDQAKIVTPTNTPSISSNNDPWKNIANFDTLPNASYYKDCYKNNDWGRILTDIKDRDLEVDYWKAQEAQNNSRITDLKNQIKDLQSKLQNSTPTSPSNTTDLVSYLSGYDYANLPFDITQAVTSNNLAFVLERFKGINSNYNNLYNTNQQLKSQAELIRDKAQTLVSSF